MKEGLPPRGLVILILGSMTALTPFAIDMYLPAFAQIAKDFGTTTDQISLSLSGYFAGLCAGQLIYGQLLDRFGRRPPLFIGLSIFILASIGCLFARSTEALVAWRFLQALGGCSASVAAMAMVRDLFPVEQGAKVFSLLMLVLGTSPLFAPTIGGVLSTALGWQSVFVTLALMAASLLMTVWLLLPESHAADPSVELRPRALAAGYLEILRDPRFYTYVVSGSIAFSGLFVYLAGSSLVFMENFQVSAQVYGWIFGIIACGFIAMSQVNVVLLKNHSSKKLLMIGFCSQVAISLVFVIGAYFDVFGLISTVAMFAAFMSCFGLTNPNSTSLALAPFGRNAGRAAALMGFLQMGVGAVASASVGVLHLRETFGVVAVLATTSTLGLLFVIWGQKRIT